MAKMLLLTAKSEIGFQSFIPPMRLLNPDQDTHKTSINML